MRQNEKKKSIDLGRRRNKEESWNWNLIIHFGDVALTLNQSKLLLDVNGEDISLNFDFDRSSLKLIGNFDFNWRFTTTHHKNNVWYMRKVYSMLLNGKKISFSISIINHETYIVIIQEGGIQNETERYIISYDKNRVNKQIDNFICTEIWNLRDVIVCV